MVFPTKNSASQRDGPEDDIETGLNIRLTCAAFGISETCYRYQPKLSDENTEVVNDFNWEGLGIEADFSLPAEQVIRSLEHVIKWRGQPDLLRCTTARNTSVVHYRHGLKSAASACVLGERPAASYPAWQATAKRLH